MHVADMAPQSYERQAGRARRDGVDGLMVEILLAGTTKADAADTPNLNVAGGMAFNDLAQAHRHVSTGTRTLLISIPRVMAERNGIDPRHLHGKRVLPDNATLLRSYLLSIHSALPDLTIAHGERLAQSTLDLLGIALDIDGARAPASTREAKDAAILLAARRLIEENLSSSALDVDWLVARLQVGRSTLYRLFEPFGGIQAYCRQRRLASVHAAIESDPWARMVDLADRWGFSDAAHLSRLFRQHYGVAPSEYRRELLDRRASTGNPLD